MGVKNFKHFSLEILIYKNNLFSEVILTMRFSFLKKKTNDSERFHRNLFLDELDSNDDGFYSDYEYEYPSDEDSYQNFKFNTLSLPLTGIFIN